MSTPSPLAWFHPLVLSVLCLGVACTNTAEDPDDTEMPAADASASDAGSKDAATNPKDSGAKDSAAKDTGTKDGSADASDAPSDGSLDGNADGSPDAPACSYAGNECASSTSIGSVRGDEGSDVVSSKGQTSRWLRATVEEGSSLFPGLSFKVTLKSPPGMNYDLFVYQDCGAQKLFGKSEAAAASPDTVTSGWGDSPGVQDDKDLFIEVRYVSGTACDSAAEWSLTLEGNK